MFIINFCLNMFRASLCPSSGEQRPCYCIWFWFCWMWLVAIVGSCLAGCDHYEGFCSTSSGEQRPCYCIWCIVLVLLDVVGSGCERPTTATNHIQQNQNNTPNAVTGPLFS